MGLRTEEGYTGGRSKVEHRQGRQKKVMQKGDPGWSIGGKVEEGYTRGR